jgi:ABC-type multidrug transport system fused ATPase/permease subunit
MAATNDLLAGRTSFMIAHRLSTLESCDMLLRFYDGKLEVITQDVKAFLRHMAADTDFSVEELASSQFRSQTAFFAEHATSLN